MIRTLERSALAATALLALAASRPATAGELMADTLVIPAVYENADGNSALTFPFGALALPFPPSNYPYRFQQVYAADAFGTPEGGIIAIHAVRFRMDQATGGREPLTVQSMEVRLGTSSKGPDELTSLEFGTNIEGPATLVFDGTLDWDPCDEDLCPLPAFDLEIPFSHPFEYDLASGNLIIDFLNLSTSYPIEVFDFANTTGDPVSHVREVILRQDGVTHSFISPSTLGLVTQFVYTVPEPGTAAAGLAALALLALRGRRAA